MRMLEQILLTRRERRKEMIISHVSKRERALDIFKSVNR